MRVVIVFWASAWIAFRLIYGSWPPRHGAFVQWLMSDTRARWALLGSIFIGFVSASISRALFGDVSDRPGDPAVDDLLRRGYACHERGELPQAVEQFEQALSLCASLEHIETARIHASLGKAYFDMGDLAKAEESLIKARNVYAQHAGESMELRHVQALLGLIDERRRVVDVPVRFHDPAFGFSVEIPAGWVRQELVPQFASTGGRVALSHHSHAANLNVSAGRLIEPELRILEVRASSVEDFVRRTAGRASEVVVDTASPVAGETNVVSAEYDTRTRVAGTSRLRRNGFISVLRGGTEYVVQWSAESHLQAEARQIIKSFTLS